MTSLNKYISYKQTKEKQEKVLGVPPEKKREWLWPDHRNHIYTSNVSTRTPFDGAPAHSGVCIKQTNKKNGKNKLKLNVKECAHLTPSENLNKVYQTKIMLLCILYCKQIPLNKNSN